MPCGVLSRRQCVCTVQEERGATSAASLWRGCNCFPWPVTPSKGQRTPLCHRFGAHHLRCVLPVVSRSGVVWLWWRRLGWGWGWGWGGEPPGWVIPHWTEAPLHHTRSLGCVLRRGGGWSRRIPPPTSFILAADGGGCYRDMALAFALGGNRPLTSNLFVCFLCV